MVIPVPGIVIDEQGDICFVIKSPLAIGVSIQRFQKIGDYEFFTKVLTREQWAVVFHRLPDEVFVMRHPLSIEPLAAEAKPHENESAQFAIELALQEWPDWGNDYRERFSPRDFIPFVSTSVEETTPNA